MAVTSDSKFQAELQSKMLLGKIKEGDFKSAYIILTASTEALIQADSDGNTIAHLAILKLIEGLRKIWSPFSCASRSVPSCETEPLKIKTTNFLSDFYEFFNKLVALNYPCNRKNKDGYLPIYLLSDQHRIRYCKPDLFKDIQGELIIILEKNNLGLFRGRKYVSDLMVYRNSSKAGKMCSIPNKSDAMNQIDGLDMTLHQRLELLEQYYSRGRAKNSSNLVFANIGLIIADSSPGRSEARKFITAPIFDQNYLVIRGSGGETGTHSEDALYEYFCNEKLISEHINQLLNSDASTQKRVYAAILDLYSTRECCLDCGEVLYKLQTENDDKSFLGILTKILKGKEYKLPHKGQLQLLIRVAGFQDPNWEGSHSDKYPKPLPCDLLDRDIKSFDQGVVLHLTPKINALIYSSFIGESNQAWLSTLYKQRRLYPLQNDDKITLQLQTAFSNYGGKKDKYTVKRASLSEKTVKLSYRNLENYTLHQFRFKPNSQVIEHLLENERLGQQTDKINAVRLIANYLYAAPDSDLQSTVDEEINSVIENSLRSRFECILEAIPGKNEANIVLDYLYRVQIFQTIQPKFVTQIGGSPYRKKQKR
jgi:hypothetical protein